MTLTPSSASAAFTLVYFLSALTSLLSQPAQPLTTVPSLPLQPDSQSHLCHLDLSDELFGGVNQACTHNLDRTRCCPVLAAWLYAAHARSALQIRNTNTSSLSSPDLPMLPDEDSQKCADSLQNSLLSRNVRLPQPNATCDALLCFCGIRLHPITSSTCPAAFKVSSAPTAVVKNLERSCRNSTYSGCSECLDALHKIKGGSSNDGTDRASLIIDRECQLMGLTWLLARNKTTYIATVSAVLRAVMYSPHPHKAQCSPDQENMPLAVDSLLYGKAESSSSPPQQFAFLLPVLPLLTLHVFFSFHLIIFHSCKFAHIKLRKVMLTST